MILTDHLGKALNRARNRGIREGIRYVRGQIRSASSYSLLRHGMERVSCSVPPVQGFRLLEITAPSSLYLANLHRIYPPEFGPGNPDSVAQMVQDRFGHGAWCFAVCAQDRLVAAFWLSPPSHWYANAKLPHLPGEYVVQNLFVTTDCRGLGLSKLLLSYGLQVARQREVRSVLSAIAAGRTASLRAHLSVGFQVIGSFRQERRWFKCREMFLADSQGKPCLGVDNDKK